MEPGDPVMHEAGAYPALPNNEYGWEKLYAERVALAIGRRTGMAVRIARLQNCYGPEGTWRGGREKAPAAIARKIATAADGGEIEIWGDGSAVRCFTYVDDMVDGLRRLMDSELGEPANIGSPEYVTVDELVQLVMRIAGKRLRVRWVAGPVGVQSRNFGNQRIESLGWAPAVSLADGMARTYAWIAAQVACAR
jgi:nucleoside-diphosphate-sugar epimerase